ncbi:SIR2 family protein [Nitrogeniibacter mangrovi]|uniref:SIR2 family protein n=1 Tax=Nitrogeniibacter mangrovi TaxID=2016596 RepID=A0A6C1B9E6_9RHOO|nr:SIR2 family protein [Nitrogeniibacter mangrovi]QID19368.1 SIR2 family protein [Nitrogeniibacter mangrovi]
MQVFSCRTNGQWLAEMPPPPPGEPLAEPSVPEAEDPALAEAKRVLSDMLRCGNFVVLSGLGTSLCVQPAVQGGAKAPTMADLWQQVQEKQDATAAASTPAGLTFLQLMQLVGHPQDKRDIEALMSRCRLAESFLSGAQKEEVVKFVALAEAQIIAATNFISANHPLPVHAEFLRRAARRPQRKSRMKIFTTNYDRCYEEAGRQGRYVVVDGFSHTAPPTFDAIHFSYETVRRLNDTESYDPIPNSFHLYKLHGSVDWQRQEISGEITKWMPDGKPVLIYPRNSKYELAFEQPYLEMISAFQTAVREPDCGVLIVGFGFNDNHLAEPIMSAIRSNLSLKIVVVSPGLAPWETEQQQHLGECISNRYLAKLHDLAIAGDARIALLNCGFEQMVSLIPDLAAETDLERHVARLRGIGAV